MSAVEHIGQRVTATGGDLVGQPASQRTPRRGQGRRVTLGGVFIWLWALLSLTPLLWVTVQSLRPDVEFLIRPWSLPDFATVSLDSYVTAFTGAQMGVYYRNSAVVVACVVALVLVTSLGAGYALSRLSFPGKRGISLLVLAVLTFPGAVLLLPMFLVTYQVGLLNSLLGLIIPYTTFTLPLSILLMKNGFDALPADLFAAARIDGCSEFRVFWSIAVPLVPGSISTVGFLVFMPVWEEFLWAFITLRDSELFTVPIGLVFLDANKVIYGYNVGFAGMVLAAAPVLIALLVSQRGFLNAVTSGAMKG